MAASGGARGHERYGWIILLVSAILGQFFALVLVVAPTSVMVLPEFRAGEVPGVLRG